MIPGETILGLDFGHHLWVVVSTVASDGRIAIVSLTTHGASSACGETCVVISVGEHPYVTRDSCVYYRRADMNPVEPLLTARQQGTLRQHEPMPADVLRRIQDGALASRFTSGIVQAAIRATLAKGLGPSSS